eukprot:9962795-Alexandrium_andersonii.AAC.1
MCTRLCSTSTQPCAGIAALGCARVIAAERAAGAVSRGAWHGGGSRAILAQTFDLPRYTYLG